MNVGSPSRMISHTDELPTDYMKRDRPPRLPFDPLSVKKVIDLIAKMKNSAAGRRGDVLILLRCSPAASSSGAHKATRDKFIAKQDSESSSSRNPQQINGMLIPCRKYKSSYNKQQKGIASRLSYYKSLKKLAKHVYSCRRMINYKTER